MNSNPIRTTGRAEADSTISHQAEDIPAYRERRLQEPPRIAIIGAGPAGLEAALYARRLGLKPMVFERDGQVATDLRAWSHVTLFTPWQEDRTPLGELALREVAGPGRRAAFPSPVLYPTGAEFVERYLDPVARLLGDDLHLETRVVAVGRSYLFPGDFADAPERRETRRFRLLTRNPLEERMFSADYVLDASGIAHSTNWAGAGGLPALGEMGSAGHVFYGIPDITGRDRIHFLGKRTLLVGNGASAATSALLLAEVVGMDPPGTVVWATKTWGELPLPLIPNDPLPRRELLFKKANLLVADKHPGFEHLPVTQVEALQHSLGTGRFQVTLQVDRVTRRIAFDSVIANVGGRRGAQTFERSLQTEEPGFFVIGAKAGQGESRLSDIRTQVRDSFRRIMADETLDLYAQYAAALASQDALAADEEMLRVA